MEPNLSTRVFEAVQRRAGDRIATEVQGREIDVMDDIQNVGGMEIPKNLQVPALVVGTERQIHDFQHTLVKDCILREYLKFEEEDRVESVGRRLIGEIANFVQAKGGLPVLVWITSRMTMIGRSAAKDGLHLVTTKKTAEPIEFTGSSVTIPLGVDLGPSVNVRLDANDFALPESYDERPVFYRLTRLRSLASDDGRLVDVPAFEELLFPACPHEHAEDIESVSIPGLRQFYESDDRWMSPGTGWLDTPHVTIVKLVRLSPFRYLATYLAYRLHRENSKRNSVIRGYEMSESFIEHHPCFRRLILKYLERTENSR